MRRPRLIAHIRTSHFHALCQHSFGPYSISSSGGEAVNRFSLPSWQLLALGKSDLIGAWMSFLIAEGVPAQHWSILAITGVAGANAGGGTLHAFARNQDGKPQLHRTEEGREIFITVRGIIIDEAMMAEQLLMIGMIVMCQDAPLAPSSRRKGCVSSLRLP